MDSNTIHGSLAAWANFYMITGEAAATLTGLQFIVQTLFGSNAMRPMSGGDTEGGIAAFGTPTVVHFALALILSAMLCAPWPDYESLRVTLGVLGACAAGYSIIVLRRARNQRTYTPTPYDWVWHILIPVTAYAAILSAAVFLPHDVERWQFVIAAATLLILCVGIHNAWDSVTYLSIHAMRRSYAATLVASPPPAATTDLDERPGADG